MLIVLLVVAVTAWQDRYRTRSWKSPLYVAIYPIAADGSTATSRYIGGLDSRYFAPIDTFFTREAARYGSSLPDPVKTRLKRELHSLPPQHHPDDGIAATMLWSLKLRYWAWRETRADTEQPDIRVFVLYHDPAISSRVPHSLGLQKGLLGVVYAFATDDMNGGNDVVIAHELAHTLGASDKYDPASDAPAFPNGYADPTQAPLYPQRAAELMAGRRAVDATHWEDVEGLDQVVVGAVTALEIGWVRHAP